MKNLIILFAMLFASINAFADIEEVKELLASNEKVRAALEQVHNHPMAKSWGGVLIQEPKIEIIAKDYSGGNPMGGNGETVHYLVKYNYGINMDWSGFSDSMLIFISKWNYSAFKVPGQKQMGMNAVNGGLPASRGLKIDKIFKSAKEFAKLK